MAKIERATIIRELGYKIYVENIKKVPVKIKIVESIPVSTTDKVKIKNIKITPSPTEKNLWDQEGVNMWEFILPPSQKKEISVEFTITYPKDFRISGL